MQFDQEAGVADLKVVQQHRNFTQDRIVKGKLPGEVPDRADVSLLH